MGNRLIVLDAERFLGICEKDTNSSPKLMILAITWDCSL